MNANSVERRLLGIITCSSTNVYTLDLNHMNANSVESPLLTGVAWHITITHTLDIKLMNALSVGKSFADSSTLTRHIQTHSTSTRVNRSNSDSLSNI